MSKVGRNAPCPCGSLKKYKRCHGSVAMLDGLDFHPSPEIMQLLNLQVRRHNAKEHRRRLMQGLGRPILAFESDGYRIIAVGDQLFWSKRWLTFHDFLFHYIKHVLTPEWGDGELAKQEGDRHPLLGWYRKVCEFQQAHVASKQGQIYTGQMTGVMKAYLGLAYDLYLCAHNAELPPLLLKRLRNRRTFEGALYEAFVVGNFAKAGFKIEMEDEGDSTSSHCEFVAIHKDTGRKFSVEAKAVTSASKRAGASAESPKIRDKLYDALCKDVDHERIVFIELSRTQTITESGEPDWVKKVDTDLIEAEREITIDGEPAPAAYVFVTNRAFMHALESVDCTETGMACGFKISDFPSPRGLVQVLETVKARDRHIELHWLLRAMGSHSTIPSSFDDRTPEEAFSEQQVARLQFGETYLVPDGTGSQVPGVLYDGVVVEAQRQAFCAYQLFDGRYINCTVPLSDAEIAIYRSSPDTFFGVIKDVSRPIKNPVDAFDFFFETYSHASREKLLEFMSTAPDFDTFQSLSQLELAETYSARMAALIWQRRAPE